MAAEQIVDDKNNVLTDNQLQTNLDEKVVDYQIYTSLIKMINSNKNQAENDNDNNEDSIIKQNSKKEEPPKSPKLSKSELIHLIKERRKQNSSILENSLIESNSFLMFKLE